MNKELEEAKERLNNFKTIKIMYGNTFAMNLEQLKQLQEDIEIALNYIENSIPKEKVEETFEYIEDYVERLNGPDEDIEYIKNKKQELLEGK